MKTTIKALILTSVLAGQAYADTSQGSGAPMILADTGRGEVSADLTAANAAWNSGRCEAQRAAEISAFDCQSWFISAFTEGGSDSGSSGDSASE